MISNPVYLELLQLGLVNESNIKIISNKVRDKEIPVYIDEISKIIFLERYEAFESYYEENASGNPEEPFFMENGYYPDDYRRLEYFKKYVKQADHLLDFGCEWGGFLHLAKKYRENDSRINISGVELNSGCLMYLQKQFPGSKFYKTLDNVITSPDLITCFHVFEHIPEQLGLLKKFRDTLSDDGTLILEIPHAKDFLIQSIDLPAFRDFTFWSEHLVLHTKESLKTLCDEVGFSSCKIFGYQRYGYTNHLGWMLDKKPKGHERYKYLEDKALEDAYKKSRVDTQTTDTLIVIAQK